MGQSAGQERPGRMLCAEERLRQAVFSVSTKPGEDQSSDFAQTLAGVGLSESE
jgi:hypothetical protein